MNVFATYDSPWACAEALDDKRVVKMTLETTQLLCTALHAYGKKVPYKPTHLKHPITLWALQEPSMAWLIQHGYALCHEYTHRYGKQHACQKVLERIERHVPRCRITRHFVNAARHRSLELDFTHLPVHEAYRAYLSARWISDKRKPIWTNREPPEWYIKSSTS